MWLGTLALEAGGQDVVIAVQPTATPEQLSDKGEELAEILREELQRKVRLVFPTSYAGVIEALRFGHAQAAFLGAWPAALAAAQAGADVALVEVREVTVGDRRMEAPFYFSYWVVLKESPVTRLEELRGKRVAFPSPLSTSGYVAPLSRLMELGLLPKGHGPANPEAFFRHVIFAGGYAQAWAALKAGQADVTVIAGDVPQALYQEVMGACRVIEQQGPIPSHAVVLAPDVGEPLRTELREALLALNEPRYQPLMRAFISGTFVRFEPSTTQQHLAPLTQMLPLTGLDLPEPVAPAGKRP
jgi:phosphonate transport system substrate-binding protein